MEIMSPSILCESLISPRWNGVLQQMQSFRKCMVDFPFLCLNRAVHFSQLINHKLTNKIGDKYIKKKHKRRPQTQWEVVNSPENPGPYDKNLRREKFTDDDFLNDKYRCPRESQKPTTERLKDYLLNKRMNYE